MMSSNGGAAMCTSAGRQMEKQIDARQEVEGRRIRCFTFCSSDVCLGRAGRDYITLRCPTEFYLPYPPDK